MRRGSKWSLCGWRAGKKLPIMEVRVDAFAEVRARVGSDPRRTWPLSEAEHSVGWSLPSTSRCDAHSFACGISGPGCFFLLEMKGMSIHKSFASPLGVVDRG